MSRNVSVRKLTTSTRIMAKTKLFLTYSEKMTEENIEECNVGGVLEISDPQEQKMANENTSELELDQKMPKEKATEHELDQKMVEEKTSEHDLDPKMAEEKTGGHELGSEPENLNTPEIQVSEIDSGADIKKWPGWPGENVFRMLVPVQKVGGIIGRKGEFIKKICEATKARIKILDGPSGIAERVVMISAKEELNVAIPPAVDGLLQVHKRVVDVESDTAHTPASGGIVCTKLLVAGAQAGSLIGKQGATIKFIQDASSCIIRVIQGENLLPFALPEDSVVEVQGEPIGVHKAIELIASHLRIFLVDRGVIPMFETRMQMPDPCGNHNMLPHPTRGVPQVFPINTGGGPGFVSDHQYVAPSHRFDNIYPPSDIPPLDQQSHQRTPVGVHTPHSPAHQSFVAKVTQTMQIPLSYADVVIGISGANISYIRRASGASIAMQETRGVPGEMTVEIHGSASQVQTAQQLLQNSMAEVANASQNPKAPPSGQAYNYPSHGAGYAPPLSNTSGYAPAADYVSVYGSY